MMEKLNYVLCYLVIILGGLCVSACSSDDDDSNENGSLSGSEIIGTWKTTSDYYSETVNYLFTYSEKK